MAHPHHRQADLQQHQSGPSTVQGPNLSSHEGASNGAPEATGNSQSRIKVNLSQPEEEMTLVNDHPADMIQAKPTLDDVEHMHPYGSANSTPNQAPMSEMNQMEV